MKGRIFTMELLKKAAKRLGIDIGSTTVKIAILDDENKIIFSDYNRRIKFNKGV